MDNEVFVQTSEIIEKYKRSKNSFVKTDRSNAGYLFNRNVEIAYYSLNHKQRFWFMNQFLITNKDNWWTKYYTKKEYNEVLSAACFSFTKRFYEIS